MAHGDYTPRYRNYVLFILFLTYVLNFLDRSREYSRPRTQRVP